MYVSSLFSNIILKLLYFWKYEPWNKTKNNCVFYSEYCKIIIPVPLYCILKWNNVNPHGRYFTYVFFLCITLYILLSIPRNIDVLNYLIILLFVSVISHSVLCSSIIKFILQRIKEFSNECYLKIIQLFWGLFLSCYLQTKHCYNICL